MNGDGKQIERVVGYLGAGGGVLAGAGHVVAAQDDEPVGPGAVLDGVRLAVVSNVAVLSDPVQTGQNALAISLKQALRRMNRSQKLSLRTDRTD